MKLLPSLILTLFLPVFGFAQSSELSFIHQRIDFSAPPRTSLNPMSLKLWDNYNNGGPTSYGSVLEFYGFAGHQTGQLYFGGWDNSRIRYREAFYDQNAWSDWVTLLDSGNDVQSSGNLLISGAGKSFIKGSLGVGTTAPAYRFDAVDHSSGWAGRVINSQNNSAVYFSHGGGYGMHINTGNNIDANRYAFQIYHPDGINYMYVRGDGNVGIGTGNPQEKLSVNGKIRGHEVRVEATNWPDYVFDEGYKTTSLENLEVFIMEKKHLPEIPTAAEVQANGIELGEMNKKLLKKIEELTLYVIEQNKLIKQQTTREMERNRKLEELWGTAKVQRKEINQLKEKLDHYKPSKERLIRPGRS